MKNKGYTFPITKEMATAKTTSRVSTIHSRFVAKQINGMNFVKAKQVVDDLITKKRGIHSYMGLYYTKTSKEILKLLKLLEANALNRGLDFETMNLFISAHMGPAYLRGRRKQSFGMKLKVTHLHAILKPSKKTKPAVKKEKKKVEKPKTEKKEVKKEKSVKKGTKKKKEVKKE